MTDFQYVQSVTHEELVLAAQLIDSRDDNAHPLNHSVFFDSRAVVLAKNAAGEIVGCAAIKAGEGPIGELGYLVVSPQYRRLGIGRALTLKRIDVAKSLGITLLFATVRLENASSRANLLKIGFKFWGNYLSIRGTGNVVGWYYFPLAEEVNIADSMSALVGERIPVA